MRALVTGGNGFVGRAIVERLRADGAAVDVLGRSGGCDVEADLAAGAPELGAAPYDLVVHAAGKAHMVPRSDAEAAAFFAVNAEGTRHLLEGLDAQSRPPEAFVLVSTVAVYGREEGEGLGEDTPLAATDPYGASKIEAEAIVRDWGGRRGVRTAVLRLPLVAGPDAPGNLRAMIRGIRTGRYLGIGAGTARRSMVLADDVAAVVPRAASEGGTYNLTDGRHPTFTEIERAVAGTLGRRPPRHLPRAVARLGGRVGDLVTALTGVRLPLSSRTVDKMTQTLTFDDARAREVLGWTPRAVTDEAAHWVRPARRPPTTR